VRRSELFATISKELEADHDCRSSELIQKAGLAHSYGSGTFGYTQLGLMVKRNIEEVIRSEMDEIGREVSMNLLQSSKLWRKSGRWKDFEGDEFFHLENRDGKEFTIAATHEEASVELVRKKIRSYRDLDFTIYQIGRKFRDDRVRKGLLRAKEFTMKDAYSFHQDEKGLDSTYRDIVQAYCNIFDQLDLDYSIVTADTGSMGGTGSHEFLAESEIGSDEYLKCDSCDYGTKDLEREKCEECGSDLRKVNGIEIGHCFKLGTRYSESMDLSFIDESGDEQLVEMGCYGIGVSRLISAIIEQNNDGRGLTWNSTVSAFDYSIIVASQEEEVIEKAEEIHRELGDRSLMFDNGVSVGEQFAESDLLGIQEKIILGRNFLKDGTIEVEDREGSSRRVESVSKLL
jgi:prolyl-tRNA synthetase